MSQLKKDRQEYAAQEFMYSVGARCGLHARASRVLGRAAKALTVDQRVDVALQLATPLVPLAIGEHAEYFSS